MQARASITIKRRPSDGANGISYRISVWQPGREYRNDTDYKTNDGPRIIDVVVKDNISFVDDTGTAVEAYYCLITHTSSSANNPFGTGENTYWAVFNQLKPLVTPVILTEKIAAKYIQTNYLCTAPLDFDTQEPTGQGVVIDSNGLTIYGQNGQKNIVLGIDNKGQSVLQFYDNEGNFQYDLGPSGMRTVGFNSTWLKYVGANTLSVTYEWLENTYGYSSSDERFTYTNPADPTNDGKVCTQTNTAYPISNGYYIKAPSSADTASANNNFLMMSIGSTYGYKVTFYYYVGGILQSSTTKVITPISA